MPSTSNQEQPRDNGVPSHQRVRSVVKATQLLLLVAENGGLTAAQAAAELQSPLPTVYNLLNTLLAEGMLTRDSARRYRLGPKIATLSVAYAKGGPSESQLQAVRWLAETTGETAHLSRWRDQQVVAMATIEGSSPVRVGQIHTELRGFEHARSTGKVMLAHLDPAALDAYLDAHGDLQPLTETTIVDKSRLRKELANARLRGYATDEGEFLEGVGCASAPVMEGGACVASIGISAPLDRFHANQDGLIEAVVTAARQAVHH